MGWIRLLWGGCKYLVEGTLMGEDFVIFLLIGRKGRGGGGRTPQPTLNGKVSGPKTF